MSTQCFMSHRCKSSGRYTFALLLGAVLAFICLCPTVVFARAGRSAQAQAPSFSPDMPAAVLNTVGVSVVRVVATYNAAGDDSPVTCTGLGTIVSSQLTSQHYENWVLTDNNVINSALSECGKAGDALSVDTIQIWNSSEYASAQTVPLDTLKCLDGSVRCTDSLFPSTLDQLLPNPTSSPAYTLFSFQSAAGEPSVSLASAPDSQMSWNVGLTQASGAIYPTPKVNASINAYLTPNAVADPPGVASTGTPAPSTPSVSNAIEGGTPEINAQDQLVDMWANDGKGGYTSVAADLLAAMILQTVNSTTPAVPSTVAAQACSTVAACWDAGMGAFYQSPATKASYTLAQKDLNQASVLNPQFAAARQFAAQAQQHLSAPDKTTSITTTPPRSSAPSSATSGLMNLVKQYQLPLIAAGVLVLILLLLILILLIRARRHRRALAQFEAEVAVSRRIAAEQEAQRQRSQQGRTPTCPNCHQTVQLTDAICPYCRFPLAPTASGLGVRLAGNAPVAQTSPLPPSAAISEQPTVLFAPQHAVVDPGEVTMPRHPAPDEPAQTIQQVRVHNLSLAVGTRSDPGIKRKHKPNEDSLFAMQGARTHNSHPQQFGLFVVADGMGGHANGQDASRMAIQTIIDFMLPKVSNGLQLDDEAFLALMGEGVQASNQAVHDSNMESHADMGTTMTAALVIGSTAYVANVGDSRTYLYRETQGLSKVTHDHSVVASLVDAGIIKPDDIYTHPKRNQIYRSLGEKPVVEVDTFKIDLLPGDKLLLCSDGLWDMVRDPLIQNVLEKATDDPNETGQKLIKAALNGGGEDNVSVIVVQFAEMNEHTGMTGVHLLAKPESVTVPNLPPL